MSRFSSSTFLQLAILWVTIIAVSGCQDAPATTQGQPEQDVPIAPVAAPDGPRISTGTGWSELTNSSLVLGMENRTGNLTLGLELDFEGPNTCNVVLRSATFRPRQIGLSVFSLLGGNEGWVASTAGVGRSPSVHAEGLLDTRSDYQPGEGAFIWTLNVTGNDITAPFLVAHAIVGMVPADVLGEPGSRVNVTCTEPFQLRQAQIGNRSVLFDEQSMTGGFGFNADGVAYGAVGDKAMLDAKPASLVCLFSGGIAGRVEVEGPEASSSWIFPLFDPYVARFDAGLVSLTVHAAGPTNGAGSGFVGGILEVESFGDLADFGFPPRHSA